MSATTRSNAFTHGPLGAVFAKTALPIILVMSMNGLLAVVDAIFLGVFVGPQALGGVTLMFPLYMLMVALATLVASGMSSLLARHLGGKRLDEARAVFAGAHGLALTVSIGLIVLFLAFGREVTLLAAGGSAALAEMGYTYLSITVLFSPLMFVLSVNSDGLRNEGRLGLAKPYAFAIPLTFLLPLGLGEPGIWLAGPLAETLLLGLTVIVLAGTARRHDLRWGLFKASAYRQRERCR